MKKVLLALLSVGLLALDLVTKTWAQTNLQFGQSKVVIDGFFELTYHKNTGVAWSMGEGGALTPIFLLISFAVSVYVVYLWLKENDSLLLVALSMILAGNMGNFIDRLYLGFVRDMLSFNIFGYAFPVFNIADVCLVVGFGVVILYMFIEERKEKHHE